MHGHPPASLDCTSSATRLSASGLSLQVTNSTGILVRCKRQALTPRTRQSQSPPIQPCEISSQANQAWVRLWQGDRSDNFDTPFIFASGGSSGCSARFNRASSATGCTAFTKYV